MPSQAERPPSLPFVRRLRVATLFLSSLVALWAAPSHSADRLTFTYGSLARTVVIEHLAQLCNSGTLPPAAHELGAALDLLAWSARDVCDPLTEPVEVDLVELDRALHSRLGEDLLFILGQIVHTPPRVAPVRSLRGAVLAAGEDGLVSGLELLQRYPTPDVMVDLVRLQSEDWVRDDVANFSRTFSLDILN